MKENFKDKSLDNQDTVVEVNIKKKKKRISAFNIINITLFILISIVTIYPFWYVILGSIMPYSDFVRTPIKLFAKNIVFSAYKEILFNNSTISRAMGLTASVTIVGTICSMIMTIIGAYVFSVRDFPHKNIVFGIIMFTMFFGGGVIPMYVLLNDMNMLNTPFVYFVPSMINTFYMIILRTSFYEVPDSLREAAELDGCGHFRMMVQMVVPLSMPAIAAITLFYAVDRWNDLYTGIYYVYKPEMYNLQVVLYNMVSGSTKVDSIPLGNGEAMVSDQIKYASIIVATVPILVVYPFLQKYFTKGIMLGAIKD